mmetsp:Transcript_129014/g.412518  ORF Transcript_129014/g.412518 Transcript_129014/m.412518 type:complete len:224 (+) Transcript_129014:1001-1672(+)
MASGHPQAYEKPLAADVDRQDQCQDARVHAQHEDRNPADKLDGPVVRPFIPEVVVGQQQGQHQGHARGHGRQRDAGGAPEHVEGFRQHQVGHPATFHEGPRVGALRGRGRGAAGPLEHHALVATAAHIGAGVVRSALLGEGTGAQDDAALHGRARQQHAAVRHIAAGLDFDGLPSVRRVRGQEQAPAAEDHVVAKFNQVRLHELEATAGPIDVLADLHAQQPV